MIDLDDEDLFDNIYDLVWNATYGSEQMPADVTTSEIIHMLKRRAQDDAN